MEITKVKVKYPVAQVLDVSQELYLRLRPFCEKLTLAGSLRREQPMVGDLEYLYVPIVTSERDGLFDTQMVDAAENEIEWMIKENFLIKRLKESNGTTNWGRLNKFATHVRSGIPIDFFATTHENWWVSLLIRTGPAGHNIHVITELKKRGYKLHAYGVIDNERTGQRIVPKSEEEIFQLAGMQYQEPKNRKAP